MKKLLGVSIAAMLAVSGANATPTQTATPITGAKATAPVSASTEIATTSYVKGAYADMAGEHNRVVADITVPALTGEGASYEAIAAGDSVADNLVALDAKVKTLNASDSTAGSVAYQVKANTQDATYEARNDYANGTIGKAIKTLETTVSAAGVNSTVTTGNFIVNTNSVAQNLEALDTEIGANVAANSKIVSSSNKVNGNIQALDTRVHALDTTNIPVYGTWGSDNSTNNVTLAGLGSRTYQ